MSKSTKPSLSSVPVKDCLTMYLSMDFVKKVMYLCQEISRIEWSGVLFYTIENIDKPIDQWIFNPIEILLMDIGSSAYTEYDFSGEIVEFMMENDIQMSKTTRLGLIHSHHNMEVYFSGTDTKELLTNSENHDVYLSVIVNNSAEFCAKVAIKATPQNIHTEAGYQISDITLPSIFVFDVVHNLQLHKDDVVDKRIEKIKQKNKKKVKSKYTSSTNVPEVKRLELPSVYEEKGQEEVFTIQDDIEALMINLIDVDHFMTRGEATAHMFYSDIISAIDAVDFSNDWEMEVLDNFLEIYTDLLGTPSSRDEVEQIVKNCIYMIEDISRGKAGKKARLVAVLRECPDMIYGTPNLFSEQIQQADGKI